MKKGTDKKQTGTVPLGIGPTSSRNGASAAVKSTEWSVLLSVIIFIFQWLLWGAWQYFAVPRLPAGTVMVLLDSTAVKCLFWAVPLVPLLYKYRAESYLAPGELFSPPFPWLACTVLLCATTAFLYTVRLASGLLNTHSIFDPMFIVFSVSAGVIEEFSFRGVYFNMQEPTIGFLPAALLNGASFTLYHYPGLLYGESWAQLISWRALLIFVMGVVFSWMLKKWRNLALNMAVHTVWDILSYLFCLAG